MYTHFKHIAGKTPEEIAPQWKMIEESIMPDIRKYNAKDSQLEICEYLLVKCDRYESQLYMYFKVLNLIIFLSFARLQQLEENEKQCEQFNDLFDFKGEKLVSSKSSGRFNMR